MDIFNYILFKNPVVTHSVEAVKYIVKAGGSAIGQNKSYGKVIAVRQIPLTRNDILNLLGYRNYFRIAGLAGTTAVIMGAYGAHSLLAKDGNEHNKKVFQTALQYHFYHTLALLAVPFCKFPVISTLCMVSGILIFCGSCYYQSLTGDNSFRRITPYGGSLLIISWLTFLL